MAKTYDAPADWAEDPLSGFIDQAWRNTIASFANHRKEYERLRDIHILYTELIKNLNNSPDWFVGFFLMRAHSAYLAAVRLALSTQVADVYIVLRGCLESSLYGLYLSGHPKSAETWIRRGDNEASKKLVKKEFTIKNVLGNLETVDPAEASVASVLYERTIDYGGHPNANGILTLLQQTQGQDSTLFEFQYLSGNTSRLNFACKSTAQVGVCSLRIFRNVFRHRFDILQLSDRLDVLAQGL